MRFVQLIFSPTGGVKRAAGLLSAPMAEQPDIIDLSLPLNGTPRFSPEDVCLIAVPCFGGRVPEIALERLAQDIPAHHEVRDEVEHQLHRGGECGQELQDHDQDDRCDDLIQHLFLLFGHMILSF